MLKRRAGEPQPWTEDAVLRKYSVCNVFREDDRTTQWFREHIRGPLSEDPRVFAATVAFRWFNRISTGELIKDILLVEGWHKSAVRKRLRPHRGERLFTGAYIIRSDVGRPKLDSIIDAIDRVANRADEFRSAQFSTLQDAHRWLLQFKLMGRFVAYELVTDLRHTYLLRGATDIDTWASAGPGAARGLAWLTKSDRAETYGSERAQEHMCTQMRKLLDASHDPKRWPASWPKWEIREVEHTLCEFDKYKRAKAGGKLRRLYGS